MVVNGDAGNLTPHGVLEFIASKLAPTRDLVHPLNLRQSPPCATRRLNCVPDDRRIALHRQTAEKPRSRHARRPPPAAAAVA
ncbi:hypothetical protein B0D71_09860 [Pseudomonas laurylsulfativorans]|uniref:Uncharacterized protein n=1 Tax=Pseudomonas laurylsulfativorans TaxID=1943631 RepID=A0A2S3VTF1_9PSED|nr:hypothetical protein B0D71_09860 [Pseudomonas laurylsulfativorans]